jgi:hypothetical protein
MQRIEGSLQALLQVFLPRFSFRLSLVEQLLSLRLVSSELGTSTARLSAFDFNEVFSTTRLSTSAFSKVLSVAA